MKTYVWEASRWYYIPGMLFGFFNSHRNFKVFPKFRVNPVSKGYQIYIREANEKYIERTKGR